MRGLRCLCCECVPWFRENVQLLHVSNLGDGWPSGITAHTTDSRYVIILEH